MGKKRKQTICKSAIKLFFTLTILIIACFFALDYVRSNYSDNGFRISNETKSLKTNLLILVNKDNPLPSDYKVNLVKYKDHEISREMYNDLAEMFEAAKKDKINLSINTSYRSRQEQQDIWDSTISDFMNQGLSRKNSIKQTEKTVLKPGYSEHETGLAIDFSKPGAYNVNNEMWNWLSLNAYKYGFILRYPETKKNITKIDYEPWHYRYVGKEYSYKITEENLCLEEYLNKED